jgi:putative sterol carrier protein
MIIFSRKKSQPNVRKNGKVDEIIEMLNYRAAMAGHSVSGETFLAVQFTLKDINECFHLEIKGGRPHYEAGECRHRQVEIIISSDNLMKLINKQLNFKSALVTGKLAIKGDLAKAKVMEKLFKM